MINIHKYIFVSPSISFGKPCFKGTRINVTTVLELLEAGVSMDDLVSDDYYPQLTKKHIQAALHYAAVLIGSGEYVPFARV